MRSSPRRLAVLLLALLPFTASCDKGAAKTATRLAQNGDVVTVEFTGKTADGKEFESTKAGGPRQLKIGAKTILPSFEQALVGMKAGESKAFTVKSADAFGPRIEDETMIQVNYRSHQPHAMDYRVGQVLEANIQYPDGKKAKREVTIIAVDDKTFPVDANHPLAGKDLHFDVKLVKVH